MKLRLFSQEPPIHDKVGSHHGMGIPNVLCSTVAHSWSTYQFLHERGTGGRGVHAEEGGEPASLVTRVVVHLQEPVSLTGDGLDGHGQGRQ